MPIWLRKFTYQQIANFKKQEQDSYNKAMSKSNSGNSTNIGSPNIPNSLKNKLMASKRPTSNTKLPIFVEFPLLDLDIALL
jgi:hypothetical protein